jgi:myo-inositol-1(or 4)-monophosphatase
MIEDMKTAALAAGAFMKASNDTEHTDKSNRKDFVTVADIKSQDMLRKELSQHYPGTVILSEEDDEEVRKQLFDANFTGFVLDPIDGTYNFKRGMKESAISIGYIEHGESTMGVIFDPYRDELYWAEKGKGAFCNGSPITVSGQSSIEGASIATSNSYDDEGMKRNLERHLAIYEKSGHMPWTSCPGSGVLIWAWVACGRIDIYHHNGLKPWDNAAALILMREAGGVAWTLAGKEAKFTDAAVLTGTPELASQLEAIFKELDPQLLQ